MPEPDVFTMREDLLVLFSGTFLTLIVGVELLLSHLNLKRYYSLKDTLLNIFFCTANMGIDVLFRVLYVPVLYFFYTFHWVEGIDNPWVYWVLLFVLEDLMFYLEHYMDHYCRLFWAVHVTHHSSAYFNLSTGFRSSVFQPLYRFIYFIPLAVLGFKPLDILFMYSATQIYGILLHTQWVKKMPAWFELVFVSPSHHRVHHGSNVLYLDKNMGMALIIWDKMFGTFQEELPEEPVRYGLKTPPKHPGHPIGMIFDEWISLGTVLKSDIGWKNKLKYLFMPPGWSHDGSSKTAKQMQQESDNRHILKGAEAGV